MCMADVSVDHVILNSFTVNSFVLELIQVFLSGVYEYYVFSMNSLEPDKVIKTDLCVLHFLPHKDGVATYTPYQLHSSE